jgi:hypothetical protein
MLLEQIQNASVKRKRLAGVNGFYFVFNLLYNGTLKSQLSANPIYVLPLQDRKTLYLCARTGFVSHTVEDSRCAPVMRFRCPCQPAFP